MPITHSPSIPTNGLVYYSDLGNPRSFSSSENKLLYSEDMTNVNWGITGSTTRTADQTQAPDGTYSADLIGNVNSVLQDVTVAGGIPVTISAYFKTPGTNPSTNLGLTCWRLNGSGGNNNVALNFNPTNGTYINSSAGANNTLYGYTITALGDGWYRVTLSGICTDLTSTVCRFEVYNNSASTTQYYMWGAQMEFSRTASPYVKTTNAAITRGTTLNDLTGTQAAGTLTSAPRYSMDGGGSLVYNGTSDYVALATPPLSVGQASYTMLAWFKCAQNASTGSIFEQSSASYAIGQRAAILQYGTYWGFNGESNDRGGPSVRLNTWVLGTIVVDKNIPTYPLTMYEYNTQVFKGDTAQGASTLSVGAGTAYIGRKVTTSGEYFNGQIGHVMVYNRPLTAFEVDRIYQATRGRYGI